MEKLNLRSIFQALTVAVAVLDGSAGGYSKQEIENAKNTLLTCNVIVKDLLINSQM